MSRLLKIERLSAGAVGAAAVERLRERRDLLLQQRQTRDVIVEPHLVGRRETPVRVAQRFVVVEDVVDDERAGRRRALRPEDRVEEGQRALVALELLHARLRRRVAVGPGQAAATADVDRADARDVRVEVRRVRHELIDSHHWRQRHRPIADLRGIVAEVRAVLMPDRIGEVDAADDVHLLNDRGREHRRGRSEDRRERRRGAVRRELQRRGRGGVAGPQGAPASRPSSLASRRRWRTRRPRARCRRRRSAWAARRSATRPSAASATAGRAATWSPLPLRAGTGGDRIGGRAESRSLPAPDTSS